jgi:hypothetical protein
MLRTTQNVSDSSRFLGLDSGEGWYQALAILLGLLMASPRLLGELLSAPVRDGIVGGIRNRSVRAGTWSDVVSGMMPRQDGSVWQNDVCSDLSAADRQEWSSLLSRCQAASAMVNLKDLEAFQLWGSQIIRFSFVLGQPSAESRSSNGGRLPAGTA